MGEILTPKILLVDDWPDNLSAMEEMLETLEANIFKAESGNDALTLSLQHQFAVILLDVMMPGMDGFEVASHLRGNEKTRQTPLIFVTGNIKDQSVTSKAYGMGAVDYLLKPFDPEMLLSKVRVFFDLDRQHRSLKQALSDVTQLSRQNQLILECAGEGIVGLDSNGRIIFVNPAAGQILDTIHEDLIGKPVNSFICPAEGSDEPLSNELSAALEGMIEGTGTQRADGNFWRANKTSVPVEYSYAAIRDEEGGRIGWVLVFTDITERKQAEDQLVWLAKYDQLTGLPNRALFGEFLANAIGRASRHMRTIAIMFLDLDHFKNVNDSLGHSVGDLLLKSVAARIKACLRKEDLVARFSGDEFAAVLDEISHAEDAGAVAQKVLDALASPHEIDGHELMIGASIGIATYPDCGVDRESLIKAADTAMYAAKEQGRRCYQFFLPHMQEQAVARSELERDLSRALDHDEFLLYYQPQVDAISGTVLITEALLRWQHPNRGLVSPSEFIPSLEQTGLIKSVGEWVLRSACMQSKAWMGMGITSVMAVNVSARQLNKNLVETVAGILDDTGVSPGQLELEITESTMMSDPESALDVLEALRALGIHMAIDDFGTGYCALSYLKRLPVSTLKIDQSFIQGIGKDANDEAIVKATNTLAHTLGLRVTAEGVETEEQVAFLRASQCDLLQGYYFGHPLPGDQLGRQLSQWEQRMRQAH